MIERLALCNEVLAPWDFARQCAYASALGYRGLEVAPFTLADDPFAITEAQAAEWRRIAADHGLAVCGLQPVVREIFEISRFNLVLKVFATLREALTAVSPAALAAYEAA